jgi:hypothetical protein
MRYVVLFAALIAAPLSAQTVNVKPTIRKDGTFVNSHQRTAPNSTTRDNWSTKPNVNPYTGKAGTRTPALPSLPKPKKN